MKTKYTALLLLSFGVLSSCQNDEVVVAPTVLTTTASDITSNSATVAGNISSDGGAAITDRGVILFSDADTQGTAHSGGIGKGTFQVALTGLEGNTTYSFQAYATNSAGTTYGDKVMFSTLAVAPAVLVRAATFIRAASATVAGDVTFNGGSEITERGVYYGTAPNTESSGTKVAAGDVGTGDFTVDLTGLSAATLYYFRPYAKNAIGETMGLEVSFTTRTGDECLSCETGTVNDVDGNTYKTVKIGTQWWMAESLRVTHFRNNDAIANIPNAQDVSGETSPEYQWPCGGNETYVPVYGRYYTWFVATDPRGVCPAGWHVPAIAELHTLADFLGGPMVAAGKMMDIGSVVDGNGLWSESNPFATNESGFTARGTAYHDQHGDAEGGLGNGGAFWATDEKPTDATWALAAGFEDSNAEVDLVAGGIKKGGLAIRCLKDN